MRRESGTITILTVLAAAAFVVGGGLWLAVRTDGRSDALVISGVVLGIAGIVFLLALYAAFQKRIEAERAEHERTIREQALSHGEKLEELRIKQRQEMEFFRSTLTHSLRMPVAIIQGYAELLSGDMVIEEKDRREYLNKIVQRSQYMTEVMSRQLSAEEVLDSGKLSYSEFDLLKLIRQMQTDMRSAAAEHSIEIRVISTRKTLLLEADAYLVNRALFNLLENSFKYMGRPGVITIRVQQADGQVSVAVRDDGMGLSAEETARIFERRFQGSNCVEGSGQGHGLYLVKQTVEAHGGRVAAQSALGQGMSITMEFPLRPTNVS